MKPTTTLTAEQQALANIIAKIISPKAAAALAAAKAAASQVTVTIVPVPATPVRPNNMEAHDKNPNLKFYRNHYGKVYNPTVCLCPWCHGVNQIGNPNPDRSTSKPGYRNWITDKDEAYAIYLLHAGFYAGQCNPQFLDPVTKRMDCNIAGIDTLHGKCDCTCDHKWQTVQIKDGRGFDHRGSRCKTCNAEFINPSSD